jgi:hypothetical protein
VIFRGSQTLQRERRKLPNGRRHIWPRREPGHDLRDLFLLLAARRVEHLPVVGECQTRREEPHRGQGDGPCGQHVEDDGKPPGRAGHLDAIVGFPFREAQGIPAVDVEGTVPRAQVHVPRVQLGEVGDELGRRVTLACDQALHPRDELGVREASERSEDVVLHAAL